MNAEANLNPEQLSAVKQTDGPVLIIAGAGSGKTRALTCRIVYLMRELGVNPENILAITFTNKAAQEMKSRISNMLSASEMNYSAHPTVGTFHSVCSQILRRHIHLLGFENQFVIYDANDQVVLMKEIMREMGIDEKKLNPKAVLGHISQAKNQLMSHAEYRRKAHNYFTEKIGEMYEMYQNRLRKCQALDFDDLIMKTVELWRDFPEILEHYRERYRYISVDEYQDTNHAQYVLIRELAAKYRNICVIGDPDQSIYSWRGANMQNILDFEKDYPDAKVIQLEQNYRSTGTILKASHAIIEKNRQRKEKTLWTEREDGEKIRVWMAQDERDEAVKVAETIVEYLKKEAFADYRKFAILYRTNAQSRILEEAFMRYGLPYKIVGGVKFYLRKEIKDIIAYLRLIQNPDDNVSLLRIINTPSRKIGAKSMEHLQNFAITQSLSVFRAMERASEIPELGSKALVILGFTKLIRHFQKLNAEFSAGGLLKHVIVESGYRDFLNEDKSPEAEARLQNINELVTVADKYEELEPGMSLAIFLEEISLISDLDTLEDEQNAITLMTLHSAKGLEFPIVFITGLEEGVFPHARSIFEPEEMEEERRLMYVGMTRAMDILYLLHARQRTLYGEFKQNSPSPFLMDVPQDLSLGQAPRIGVNGLGRKPIPVESEGTDGDFWDEDGQNNESSFDFQEGDLVMHRNFGEGVILSLQGGLASIAFKDSRFGVKKLALSIAPLKKL